MTIAAVAAIAAVVAVGVVVTIAAAARARFMIFCMKYNLQFSISGLSCWRRPKFPKLAYDPLFLKSDPAEVGHEFHVKKKKVMSLALHCIATMLSV